MKQYWMRILGAWLLLSLAGRMMKSAESVLRAAQEATSIDEPSQDEIIGAATEANNDVVEGWVEARYDG